MKPKLIEIYWFLSEEVIVRQTSNGVKYSKHFPYGEHKAKYKKK
jgi:hypothetical protein